MDNSKTEEISFQEKLDKTAHRKKVMANILPYMGLVFVIVFFSIACGDKFVDINNLANLINQSFTYIIVAAGASFIYATGAMDMSVGTVLGMGMLAAALVLRAGLSWILALLAAIVMDIALEIIISVVYQKMRVPVFIVTLCMMYLLQGILAAAVKQEMAIDYYATAWLNSAWIKAIVLIVMMLIAYYLFHMTKFGIKLKSIGSNRTSAEQAGIKCFKVVVLGFVTLGAFVGVAAFFSLTRTGYTTATAGAGIMLNIMISIVLGGNPLTGGSRFRLINSVVGALTVTILTNGLTLLGLAPALIEAFKGVLYLIIVLLTYDRSRGVLVS
jgi:ribose transport system permease protein